MNFYELRNIPKDNWDVASIEVLKDLADLVVALVLHLPLDVVIRAVGPDLAESISHQTGLPLEAGNDGPNIRGLCQGVVPDTVEAFLWVISQHPDVVPLNSLMMTPHWVGEEWGPGVLPGAPLAHVGMLQVVADGDSHLFVYHRIQEHKPDDGFIGSSHLVTWQKWECLHVTNSYWELYITS